MIGILADDFTGATELAGVAWRFGLSAEVHTEAGQPSSAQVLALDTDSRGCASEEAAGRAAAAALRLQPQGWLYKKIDSVLRGPVLAELEATMASLQLKRALVLPANPGLGRVIRHGHYFLGGQPLHETDFRNDPQHPCRSSRVLEMLAPLRSLPVCVCPPDQPLPAAGIVLGEAASPQDLRTWARRLQETDLPAGGAEFFAAILERNGHQPLLQPPLPTPADSRPALFVCGSLAAPASAFIAQSRKRGWPVFPLPEALLRNPPNSAEWVSAWAQDALLAFRRHSQVIMAIDKPLVPEPVARARLGTWLVGAARTVLEHAPLAHVYVEGGATAVALVRALGWSRMQLLRELAPGVVTLQAEGNQNLQLTSKPGSYTWPAMDWG